MSGKLIVAIDGPAAAGKGTLARRLAAALGLPYLDTGLLYRATARRLLNAGGTPADPDAAAHAAASLTDADLARTDLRTPEVDRAAAAVASIPGVRAALLDFQRRYGREAGAVLDGRDIGTVICPDAECKIFVTAAADVRARRRTTEYHEQGREIDEATVLADILKRDERDQNRAAAPLKRAQDAHLLDTTNMDISTAIRAAIDIVEATRAGRGRA